jgi:predicted AAA+ superfamily ATPase
VAFHHFRNKDGVEVDVVLERGGRQVAGIEIKSASTVTKADFKGLSRLKDAAGSNFIGGTLLYDGETLTSFGDGMYAVPISLLWEMP